MDVTIIIPIYNVEPYIEKCLQSVAAQTYSGEIECLLIDDCGTDNSMVLTEQFVNDYNSALRPHTINFQILHHDHNRGLSAARNTGMDAASSEWIYFLDSDDWITNDCIEIMMKVVVEHPDTDAVFAGTNVINGEHGWADYENRILPKYSDDLWWINTTLLKRNVLGMTAWNKLLRRETIEKYRLQFVEGIKHEDEIWNMQLSRVITKLAIVPKNTYYYLKRQNSIMRHQLADKNRFYYHMQLCHTMSDNIIGYRWQVQNQVKMVAGWSVGTSLTYWPHIKRTTMPSLLLKLAVKARSRLSIYLVIQALLSIVKSSLYRNEWFFKRMAL